MGLRRLYRANMERQAALAEVRTALPDTIRKARRTLGMTQRQLAAALGIDHTYISHMERGKQTAGVELLCRLYVLLDAAGRQ